MPRHTPRFDSIDEYDSLLEYLDDAPVGEIGEIILELELRYPRDSWRKRREIRRRLDPEFRDPVYYAENVEALMSDHRAWREYPEVLRRLAARRSRGE